MLEVEPFYKFRIPICTEDYDKETEENGLACFLVFAYTEKYPDEAPGVEIEDSVNFLDDYDDDLVNHVKETVLTLLFLNLWNENYSWCFFFFIIDYRILRNGDDFLVS